MYNSVIHIGTIALVCYLSSTLISKYKLGTKAAVAARKICTAFGNNAVSNRTARKWFKKFSSEDLGLTDEARSGRLKIINSEDIQQVMETNSRTTCLELSQRLNVSAETSCLHLHQLGKT